MGRASLGLTSCLRARLPSRTRFRDHGRQSCAPAVDDPAGPCPSFDPEGGSRCSVCGLPLGADYPAGRRDRRIYRRDLRGGAEGCLAHVAGGCMRTISYATASMRLPARLDVPVEGAQDVIATGAYGKDARLRWPRRRAAAEGHSFRSGRPVTKHIPAGTRNG